MEPSPQWACSEPPRANRALEMLRGRTSARQPHVGRLDSVTYLWGSRAVVTSSTAPDVHATREGCIVTASGAPVILGLFPELNSGIQDRPRERG